jgi:hypothetical protein
VKAVVGAGALVLLAACASVHQDKAESPSVMESNPHKQIEQRMAAIADAMSRDGIQPACLGASCEALPAAALTLPTKDDACHPGPSDTCKQSCTLGDSICDDAQHVCDLADSLPGDEWAQGKCGDAKQSCHAAHDRCCTCT